MKNTKRALLTSVIALVMCITMLVGTTFAWFTDNAESLNNKIVAGELDMVLSWFDGTDYVDISDSKAPIFGAEDSIVAQNKNIDTLWEPGKTQVAYFNIANAGNLSLKYQVAVIARDDDSNLYEVMQYDVKEDVAANAYGDWTTGAPVTLGTTVEYETKLLRPGESQNFALALHMLEEAGNEYMNGEMSFDIKVLATQAVDEADYYDNTYDENAAYPVTTVDEFKAAIAAGEPIIALGNDMPVDEVISIDKDVAIDLQGHKIINNVAKSRAFLITGNDVDFTIYADDATVEFNDTYAFVTIDKNVKNANVTINNGTFVGTSDAGSFVKPRAGATGKITLNNVNYKDNYTATANSNTFACVIDINHEDGVTAVEVEVNGGTYESAAGFLLQDGTTKGTFNNVTVITEGYSYLLGADSVVNGGSTQITGTQLSSDGTPCAAVIAANQATVEVNNVTFKGTADHVGAVLNSGGDLSFNGCSRKFAPRVAEYKVWEQDAGCTGTITVNGAVRILK